MADTSKTTVEEVARELKTDCAVVHMQFHAETLAWFARWAIRFRAAGVREAYTESATLVLASMKREVSYQGIAERIRSLGD